MIFVGLFKYIRLFHSKFRTQVPDAELSKLTSLSAIQTKGLKRQFAEDSWLTKMTEAGTEVEQVHVRNDYGESSNIKGLFTQSDT
jgi:hypothetical protein